MNEAIAMLEFAYQQVTNENRTGDLLPVETKANLDTLLQKIESDKSLIQVLVTSLLKKITVIEQDIRLHMKKFDGGYSARVLDTKVTTPFFKNHFPKYANKETAFLTKATRAEIKWNLDEGRKLPLRSQTLVMPFLQLLDQIQYNKINLTDCLCYILAAMYQLTLTNQRIVDETVETANFSDVLNIKTVMAMLRQHFALKYSSRLPVIAIFAAYQQLVKTVKRYEGKILQPLNVHTSSDKHGWGDVEIWNQDGTPFEMVEVKHLIPIDRNLVFDVVKKSQNTTIQRYYVLTTYPGSFADPEEETYADKLILKINRERNLEVIANGLEQSLKYYLRFVNDYQAFIQDYTNALALDAQRSTEVKDVHLTVWKSILTDYQNQAS